MSKPLTKAMRKVLESVGCSCPPRCDVTMASDGIIDPAMGSHSITPQLKEATIEIGGKCSMHKALEALQPKEERG